MSGVREGDVAKDWDGPSSLLLYRKFATSGTDAEADGPFARSCSSICMPGNGKSFASWYLCMSAEVAGGIGEGAPRVGVYGAKDVIDADADDD